MSSSESDEFESADESFDDENNVKEPKVNINRDKCRNKLSVSLIKSDETVEKEENNEMINKEKDIVDEIEENVEEEIVMAIAEIVKEERENLLNTLNVKTKTVVDEMSDSHEKPVSAASTPDFQADGWEFDDWGDEESINKSLPQLNLKKDTDLSIDDKDEWNFEDWGDNSTNQDSKQLTVASTTLLTTSESDSRDIIKKEDGSQISLVFDKLANEKSSGWKSWGNVASFITSASESVASITTNVSKGISNVIESSIGIPEPEELVKLQHEKKNLSVEVGSEEHTESSVEDTSSLGKIVSGVTQMSNRVIAGGLDTLEGIGKKTMNMLQENDPLLLNKRKMLGLDSERTILSQVLREAKNKTEENEKNLKAMQKHMYKKQIHFETLFDGYHGLVHLEALEMLSKQSSLKLQSLLAPLSGKALQDLQETLNEVRELCELPDTDNDEVDGMHTTSDLNEKLAAATEDLGVTVEFNEILKYDINIYIVNLFINDYLILDAGKIMLFGYQRNMKSHKKYMIRRSIV